MFESPATGPLPPEVIARATAYLESKVGAAYAKENFEFVSTASSIGREFDSDVPVQYRLQYKFQPYERVGAPDAMQSIIVPMPRDLHVRGLSCCFDAAGKVVEPKLTRQQAGDVAGDAARGVSSNSPSDNLSLSGCDPATGHPQWYSSVVTSSGALCWKSRMIRIDAVTAAVIVDPETEACE